MHVKIYFGNKPLFLCDAITTEIEPFLHHDDAVLIDELSAHSVHAMIHEMQTEKVHAGVFLHPDLDKLKKAVWKKFTVLQAAGGLVLNEKKQVLFIFRRGFWDLPKGKLEEGEKIEECAVREVQEETGIQQVELKKFLLTTFHTYKESGKHILKESYWYQMKSSSSEQLKPQTEEEIHEIKWVSAKDFNQVLNNTFPSIKDVIEKFKG
jgi:8-oxo-dGTP pyrophosphatase MutT (NUDIX family)